MPESPNHHPQQLSPIMLHAQDSFSMLNGYIDPGIISQQKSRSSIRTQAKSAFASPNIVHPFSNRSNSPIPQRIKPETLRMMNYYQARLKTKVDDLIHRSISPNVYSSLIGGSDDLTTISKTHFLQIERHDSHLVAETDSIIDKSHQESVYSANPSDASIVLQQQTVLAQ